MGDGRMIAPKKVCSAVVPLFEVHIKKSIQTVFEDTDMISVLG